MNTRDFVRLRHMSTIRGLAMVPEYLCASPQVVDANPKMVPGFKPDVDFKPDMNFKPDGAHT